MKRRLFGAVLLLSILVSMLAMPALAIETGTFTVYFETGGGTGIPIIATTTSSGKLTSLPEPTMSGYKFEGWYTDELEGDKITLNTEFASDATIYARWLPLAGESVTATAGEPDQSQSFRLKAHAGTILVAGTMLTILLVLYSR